MILSLAKVDTLRIEDMLKKSYSEIDSTREVPLKRKELQKVISELSLVREHTTCPPEVDRFYAMCERLKDISMEISVNYIFVMFQMAFRNSLFYIFLAWTI